MVSYDFDRVIIDWNNGTFLLVRGMDYYEYNIYDEQDVLSGALAAGVPFSEE